MNRDDLDAFFAKADDVLDEWDGSDDSMCVKDGEVLDVPDGDRLPALLAALTTAAQSAEVAGRAMQEQADAHRRVATSFGQAYLRIPHPLSTASLVSGNWRHAERLTGV